MHCQLPRATHLMFEIPPSKTITLGSNMFAECRQTSCEPVLVCGERLDGDRPALISVPHQSREVGSSSSSASIPVSSLCARERRLRSQFMLPLTAAYICEPSQRASLDSRVSRARNRRICSKNENGPPPGGCAAENAHSMRTDFWGNSRFTYEFFAMIFSDTFAGWYRRWRANHATKREMARRRNLASQVKVRSIATLALSVVVLLLRQPF